MPSLVIVGAGGFGRELFAMLREVFSPAEYPFRGFLGRAGETAPDKTGRPLLGEPERYEPNEDERFLLAIGSMPARVRIVEQLESRGARFISFIHPSAHVAPSARIGLGAVIYPFAVVSNEAILDAHVHLNYYASVGHDASVGRYCLLAPYATLNGFCRLEHEVYVSTHATVAIGRKVGAGTKISANSAVMQDVPEGSFVFGVPGRCTRRLDWPERE